MIIIIIIYCNLTNNRDERYMATNDLCTLLSRDSAVKIDEQMEARICSAVLKQLDDKSNDVQSVAVKCLAILLKKVQQTQVGEICKKLCSLGIVIVIMLIITYYYISSIITN